MAVSPAVTTLCDNSNEVFLDVAKLLLTYADNILRCPNEEKYRSIRIGNPTFSAKLLPVKGAVECLFEMGFEEESSMSFFLTLQSNFQHVMLYENLELQQKALSHIPHQELSSAAQHKLKEAEEADPDCKLGIEEFLVLELLRYNNPEKLLETRRGRCGEWANCFTLCCRALGLEARYIWCSTDHVWTEIYSVAQHRWLHCDSCENVCDKPLLYEVGWGKKLAYVLAFSKDQEAGYVFTPTEKERSDRLLHVCYIASKDQYCRLSSSSEVVRGWDQCVWKKESVFRKVEDDWQMVYIARTEGSSMGRISWKFDFSAVEMKVKSVSIRASSQTFDTGRVCWYLQSGQTTTEFSGDGKMQSFPSLCGSSDFIVEAQLCDGSWQHSQLFRQSLKETEEPSFEILIHLEDA
ncbi:hypothetical protein F2P81_023438 [Scophthalmus maximus]|uniref:Peptide-N(4)-(N-acetyl-beta-glucosaminyl)asparagine amidase n=1 Tax=Scophthalmus maximus TaxID=52904 RepID=A0A6A4RPU8_SCOMX|nr:hypothetical protein F2P81_023438 [Scophthalmus maximus]